jgi:hypothetical protein
LFYNSILEFIEDPEEEAKVQSLLAWWNLYVGRFFLWSFSDTALSAVFPAYSQEVKRVVPENSALVLLRQRRERLKATSLQIADLAVVPVGTGPSA